MQTGNCDSLVWNEPHSSLALYLPCARVLPRTFSRMNIWEPRILSQDGKPLSEEQSTLRRCLPKHFALFQTKNLASPTVHFCFKYSPTFTSLAPYPLLEITPISWMLEGKYFFHLCLFLFLGIFDPWITLVTMNRENMFPEGNTNYAHMCFLWLGPSFLPFLLHSSLSPSFLPLTCHSIPFFFLLLILFFSFSLGNYIFLVCILELYKIVVALKNQWLKL